MQINHIPKAPDNIPIALHALFLLHHDFYLLLKPL